MVGVSRVERTSNVHCLAAHLGHPVTFALTPGNVADIVMVVPLLEAIHASRCLIVDKAYNAMRLRSWLKKRQIKTVIPSTATRTKPRHA